MKTKKAAAKRFRFTATGKVKFNRAGKRHNLGNKSTARKAKLRAGNYVHAGEARAVARNLPYGN